MRRSQKNKTKAKHNSSKFTNRHDKLNSRVKMKLWKKILLGGVISLLLLLGVFFAYATVVLNQTESSFKATFADLGLTSSKKADKNIKATKPITVLLMGVDTGDSERSDLWSGQSDTMIIMTINPETKTTTMVSLERDMLTDIIDKDSNILSTEKLNAAYATGGAVTAVSTIQQQIGLDIDKYALINMNGLKELVDAVGGVDINNTLGKTISISDNEPEYTATIKPGKHHIDGNQALVYARMRYQDPEGDIGRQARQREVIEQLVGKILSLNSVTKYEKILKAISGNMKTDFSVTASSLKSLIGYKDAFQKIKSIKLQGVGETISEASYQVMPSDNLLGVQNALRLSLGKSTISSLSPNIVTYENYFGYTSEDAIAPTISTTVDGKTTEKTLKTDGSETTEVASSSNSDYEEQTSEYDTTYGVQYDSYGNPIY